MRPIQIHLDRLQKALGTHGFAASRSQALEIAAAAFGHHNSNEFTAASKRGDLTPAAAEYVGTATIDGIEMVVLRDPNANARYAIEEGFVDQVVEETRRERFGLSPYGHMLDVSQVASAPPKTLRPASPAHGEVCVAIVEHRHGTNTYVDATMDGIYKQLREYCDEWWHEVEDRVQIDLKKATDEEVVDAYFEAIEGESVTYSSEHVGFKGANTATAGDDEERTGEDDEDAAEEDAETVTDEATVSIDGLDGDKLAAVKQTVDQISWNLSHHLAVPSMELSLDEALSLGALLNRVETARKASNERES